jgi:hypothetical protein
VACLDIFDSGSLLKWASSSRAISGVFQIVVFAAVGYRGGSIAPHQALLFFGEISFLSLHSETPRERVAIILQETL